ncbi:MAG: glycosyltransferase family 4 protein [Alicyclobacillus sp.]|nr:glycosyltransferase family 4 protein [Alicyclobacillus sp.]
MTERMRIYAWPRQLRGNAYLRLFYDAVIANNVDVVALRWRPLSIIRASMDRTRPKWLHFHWVGLRSKSFIASLVYWVLILAGIIVLRLGGTSIVWTLHNLEPHDTYHPSLDRWGYRILLRFLVDKVVCHSTWTASALHDMYDWNGDCLVVPHGNYLDAYPGVRDLSPPEPRHTNDGSITVLFFGTLSPYKGLDDLVEVFKTIDCPKLRLRIVGSGRDSDVSKLLRAARGHDRIVIEHRFVEDHEIAEVFQGADVVVLPYRNITTSGTLILAFSAARAVIAPRMGSIPEYADNTCALLYDCCDTDGLRRALHAAATADLHVMGMSARQKAELWNWSAVARQFVDTLR